MKANELRIGNLVYLWHNALEYSEFEANYTAIRQIHQGIEAYTPIPLTEEWLLKFGFEKDCDIYTLGVYTMYSDDNNDLYFCFFMYGDWEKKIEHVHQLQNLYFALTGEELTYETTK